MLNEKVVMPFAPDAPNPPLDPVQQAVIEARRAHEQSIQDARRAWESRAISEFDKHEANRRVRIIRQWKEDNPFEFEMPPYKYDGWEPAAIYRDQIPPTDRVQRLLEAGLYDQATKCFLVRAGGTATVDEVQKFLQPWMPVTGDCSIVPSDADRERLRGGVHSHAEGLSPTLYDILTGYMVKVWLGGVTFDWRYDCDDRESW